VTVTTSPRRLRAAAIAAAAVLAAALAVATPAGGAAPDDRPPSLLAKLAAGADGAGLARDHGLVLARSFPEIGWAELEVPSGDPLAAGRELLRDGRVFRLDFQRRGETLAAGLIPRDPFTTTPISLGQGLTSDYHWRQANFFPAWDVSRGSSAVRIAVVDSEFDTEHPDLKTKFATGYNAERQTGPYRTSNVLRASAEQIQGAIANPDNNTLHGTHVAGLAAAASDNLIGTSGAGFDSVILPVKVSLNFQVGDTADAKFVGDAVEGIRWAADNGAAIINMSFGTPRFHQSLQDAVNYAASKGVLLVAAAGNTQADPAARGTIQYPAAFQNVLAVAATDQNSAVTDFSTNGNFVDVAAPGAQVLSTWDVRAPGIVVNGQNVQGFRFLSGTSMASPIVAGLAGLMKAVRPDLSPGEIEALILQTAVDVGAQGKDPQFGAGIINADAAVRAAVAFVRPAAPGPAAAPARRKVRIFYSCKVGKKTVRVGKPGRLGVVRNQRLVCKGRTAPALRKTNIVVQRFAARGGWRQISKVKTNNRGRFGFTIRLRTLGNWTVRAAFAGNAALAPAGSLGAKVLVGSRR
jgi:subtilisin family serine protease